MALLAMFQAPAQGVNWLSVFAQNLTNLTTQNGGVLTSVGMSLLSFVAIMMLVQMVISINTANWTISFRPQSVDAGTVMRFMLRLGFCALLEHYWVNPFPGASFWFNHLFSYLAEALAQVLDQTSLNTLTTLLREASTKMDTPSLTAPLELLCYMVVQAILGVSSAILFLINISSFILYGVSALFGPVFIPLYLTNSFRAKFFQYIDVLIGFAMIRAVAAAFLFVWAGFLTTFIQQTFNGDYSIAMWLANLVPVITMFVAFILNMLFIPSLTQAIFGGAAGMAGRAEAIGSQLIAFAGV
jgi:hypothetical protein